MNPQLAKIYNDALSIKAEILEDLKPLREAEEKAIKKYQSAEAELKSIRADIVKIEIHSDLAGVCKTIAILAPNQMKLNA